MKTKYQKNKTKDLFFLNTLDSRMATKSRSTVFTWNFTTEVPIYVFYIIKLYLLK